MKLIVISAPKSVHNEEVITTHLFEQGLEHFHLRRPGSPKQEMKDFIEKIPCEFHNRIVLHSNYELADSYGLQGAHYSKKNTSFFSRKCTYHSTSFHSLESLMENDYPYKYTFLSPIFESISKPGHFKAFNYAMLSHFLKENKERKSVIALGGVDEITIKNANHFGFDGAALLGTIWNRSECVKSAVNQFNIIKNICSDQDELKNLSLEKSYFNSRV